MPAGLMRIFGGTTKTQLLVLGLVLTVLGAVGAFGVMFLPNEDPASLISAPAKGKYYSGVSVWAIFAFLMVAMAGLLVLGTALTGLPFVHMAKYHTGVFYVSLFSLLLIPTAVALKSGAALYSNAAFDTMFADPITGDEFSSPAGFLALVLGFVLLGLCVMVVLLNLLSLSKVAFRPQLVRGGGVTGMALTVVIILTYTVAPMLPALQFDHEEGRQGAVGFEEFPPGDVSYNAGWVSWLSKGEYSSTYGSISTWLGLMSFMLLLALIISVVGFIGLALYSANDRSPNTYTLSIVPLGAIALVVVALLFYVGYGSAVGQLAERLNVSSEVTRISYGTGSMAIAMVMMLAAIGAGAGYGLMVRPWLAPMFSGRKVRDPISMSSLVDPPTGLPKPPTGWPANWNKMSTANIAIMAVAALLVLSGFASGYYVKGREDTTGDFTPVNGSEVVDLDELPDEQRSFTFNDYAAEGGTRPFLWQPDGTWFIKRMELHVTWTDEQPFFRHENLPDTFRGVINASNGEGGSAEGSSTTTTLSGELRCIVEFDNYILMSELPGVELPPQVIKADVTVNITCVTAGDQEPIGAGILSFADDGNAFAATLNVDFKPYVRNA